MRAIASLILAMAEDFSLGFQLRIRAAPSWPAGGVPGWRVLGSEGARQRARLASFSSLGLAGLLSGCFSLGFGWIWASGFHLRGFGLALV